MPPIYDVQVGYDSERRLVVSADSEEEALDLAADLLADWEVPRTELAVKREREVHETVGQRFRGPGMAGPEPETFVCVAYDWRTGFWMRDEKTHELRDVSERAPGRTYHRIVDWTEGEEAATDRVRRWVASDGEVCSLQMDNAERAAATRLVRSGAFLSERHRCGALTCRHYREA